MFIRKELPSGSLSDARLDLDSNTGTALNTALLEMYFDRVEQAGDPMNNERLRVAMRERAEDTFAALEFFFPGYTRRIH